MSRSEPDRLGEFEHSEELPPWESPFFRDILDAAREQTTFINSFLNDFDQNKFNLMLLQAQRKLRSKQKRNLQKNPDLLLVLLNEEQRRFMEKMELELAETEELRRWMKLLDDITNDSNEEED